MLRGRTLLLDSHLRAAWYGQDSMCPVAKALVKHWIRFVVPQSKLF